MAHYTPQRSEQEQRRTPRPRHVLTTCPKCGRPMRDPEKSDIEQAMRISEHALVRFIELLDWGRKEGGMSPESEAFLDHLDAVRPTSRGQYRRMIRVFEEYCGNRPWAAELLVEHYFDRWSSRTICTQVGKSHTWVEDCIAYATDELRGMVREAGLAALA